MRYPQGHVLLRNLNRNFPVISHGKGVFLYDTQGKEYLDAVGGAFVASVGHGNEEVVSEISASLSKVAYVNGTQFTNPWAEELAEGIASRVPVGFGPARVGFLASGSEANEAAAKFVRQVQVKRGQEKRTKFIARMPGYHGNTLFSLSASGRPGYKTVYADLLHEVIFVDAPQELWCKGPYAESGEGYAQTIERAIEKEGAENIAGIFIEPIGGSSTAACVPPPGYLKRVREICNRHGVMIIADEVLVGAGRTGTFFACEHDGFVPDVLVMGKGISGGYAPLSSLIVKEEDLTATGGFMHAQTYLHAPCNTSAGLAVLNYMERHDLVKRSAEMGVLFHQKLKALDGVAHVGGKGLLAGLEYVTEKPGLTQALLDEAFEQGLILWPNAGHREGGRGDILLLAPPLTITENEVEEILVRLQKVHKKILPWA